MAVVVSAEHKAKYPEFLRMITEAGERGVDIVVIAWPTVLGDTYDEIITNLALLAEAGLQLAISKPSPQDATKKVDG